MPIVLRSVISLRSYVCAGAQTMEIQHSCDTCPRLYKHIARLKQELASLKLQNAQLQNSLRNVQRTTPTKGKGYYILLRTSEPAVASVPKEPEGNIQHISVITA